MQWVCVARHGWATEKFFGTKTSNSGVYNGSFLNKTSGKTKFDLMEKIIEIQSRKCQNMDQSNRSLERIIKFEQCKL